MRSVDPPPWPVTVLERLESVPSAPGCYLFRDANGEVLYVGKAVNLRPRVRSYFQASARHGARIARLVRKTQDIEWIVVDSEVEALVLECNLIKQHRPPFNVRLRDDKSYPYILITDEPYPRVLFTRRPRKGSGRVFGPYTFAWSVRETLQLLHKVFPLIPCGKSWSGRPEQRPCLYYHLGQCLAPCAGLSSPEAYRPVIEQVVRFLSGKSDEVLAQLRKQMNEAAAALDFERAAQIRDRIKAIENLMERQRVLAGDEGDRDVIAVVKDERGAAIQMLYVRGGKLIGQHQFFLDGSSEVAPGEAVQEFVKQYYAQAPEVPREIVLPIDIEERQIVEQWLRSKAGAAVRIEVPRGGEKLRLVEMAATNAEMALETFLLESQDKEHWAEVAAAELAEALGLPAPPSRIEGFDISNIQGTAPVGSMVVSIDGQPAKSEYRRFKIRYHPESPNDFAMMHEIVTRRLQSYLDGDEKFSPLPDLILVDGGKGQLMAALTARDRLGLTVPMVGLAKRLELLYVPEEGDGPPPSDASSEPGRPSPYRYREVELPLQSPGLVLLRRLRDEAHRFALSFHRKIREKRATGSVLDEIPGVGPRRRRMLLRTFGSIDAIRRASIDEIAAVPTMTRTLATRIREYLREE